MATPGIGDPYWYEWFVGLKYIIEMLNPDSGITSVTFQHSEYDTIDDVVVEYHDGKRQLCYQVKHQITTSAAHNLTFGNMLEEKNGKPSLFMALFMGWQKAQSAGGSVFPILYTNRHLKNRRANRHYKNQAYRAYPVDEFISNIKTSLSKSSDYTAFRFDDPDMENQWNELCLSLGTPNKTELLSFLSAFTIEANQPGLSEIQTLLISKLAHFFQCNNAIASELFTRLLRGLTTWTTSARKSEKVIIEDVYSILGIEEDHDSAQHRLAPPFPFFVSRKTFCDSLCEQLKSTDKKLVFISGDPGSGKTSTVSYLQSSSNFFYLRYHTFKPISPEQRFYDSDHGLCTTEKLWGTFLIQLREKFIGRLQALDIPVSNKLVSNEELRKNVLRLLGVAAQEVETGNKLFICIDGIDHAARAKNQVSFLPSLPTPAEIPDGVCFVVVGQPLTLYQDQYPSWMANNPDILLIDIPKLCKEDIEQLIIERIPPFSSESAKLANLIQQKTAGNNLSAAFAVEEIKSAHSIEEAYQILSNTRISDNINQYYDHIWAHLKNLLSQIMPNKICPESYVACPLLLMNGRVNTRILTQALQRNISKADWALLLDHLYPLVIPTNSPDEYTLFHNDFRIYLQSIVYQYKQRYEELAYDLAKYLLENDEGLISYVLGIPLLKHANKVDDIPKYFGTGFVINALAEGISQQRLDDFARDAYQAACANQDIEGYRNVYFALKTIYQHRSYFEYFEREYICLDYPEIEQVDIAEIRTLPISKENLHEYEKVLSLCNKLYSSSRSDSCSRAIGLYNMWFGHLTPLSFISLAEDETGEDDWALKATDVGIMLQHWGHTAAFIERPALKVETDESYLKTYAVMLWGDEYFKCCLDNEKHDLAIAAVQAGVVSRSCVTEKLEQILYDGATDTYKPILQRITYDDENPAEHLLSLAMQVTCCCHFIPKDTATAFSGVNKQIYDASCFELILKAFLQGRLSNGLDDDMVIQAADTLCKGLEKDQKSKEQAIHLARTSALLGKYYWDTDTVSDKLNGYVVWFLTASLYRPYDYSKACHFILYVLLNSKLSSYFAKQKEFLNALHIHLFESRQLGMYYKTHILDFYVQHNMLENIREYILALYGANCEAISAMENRVDIHRKFSPYGNLVEPEMMQKFSVQLKWDVVGYLGHDEYAMYSPSELFELITKRAPSDWKDLGNILYCQSQIADKSSNKASYQIRANIAEAAAHCSLTDYWELRTWHDDFRLDPDLIIRAIVGAIQRTTTTDDLISLWLLGCGISSWYVPDDHQNAKAVYDACIERATELHIDISSSIAQLTPQWVPLVKNGRRDEREHNDIASYYSKRKKRY